MAMRLERSENQRL